MEYRFFTTSLLAWHKSENTRKLPWKGEKDPYKIWLSEIILQQTRVEQGIKYYENFVQSFPDIKSLALAPERVIYKKWEGLGYYSRCKNLIATAKQLHEDYNGIFPDAYEEIIALKGIGEYTAAAIASFAYGLPYAVVDGNVKRVIARYFGIDKPVDTTVGQRMISVLATKLLSKKNPALYNQAIMDFGATICKPAKPDCPICPLRKKCRAFQSGTVAQLPLKTKRIDIRKRYFNYLVITSGKSVFIKKRGGRDIWENLYEPVLIESGKLLTASQIKNQTQFTPYFENGSMEILGLSKGYSQQLTHQKITAQFIRIRTAVHRAPISGYKPVAMDKLDDFAFPKIVATYLKDYDISLNLNFR